nr:hypothetical protein [uncultured Desulfobacter sp.]
MMKKRIFYRDLIDHDHVDTDSGEDQIGLLMRSAFNSRRCPICMEECSEYRHTPEVKSPPKKSQKILTYFLNQLLLSVKNVVGGKQRKKERF